jgi:hypothetical protein
LHVDAGERCKNYHRIVFDSCAHLYNYHHSLALALNKIMVMITTAVVVMMMEEEHTKKNQRWHTDSTHHALGKG